MSVDPETPTRERDGYLWSSERSFLLGFALCLLLLGFMFHDGICEGEDFPFLAAVCDFHAGMDEMEEDAFLDYRNVVDMIQVTTAEPMAEKLARLGPLRRIDDIVQMRTEAMARVTGIPFVKARFIRQQLSNVGDMEFDVECFSEKEDPSMNHRMLR